MKTSQPYDVVVIGGGVNGCGIARDLSGRGLRVLLCEQSDLAQATSSASTKLFHGGLRYLEYYEFRLVREALIEREILLRAMPHIAWPLRFVLPHHQGLRPKWMLRLGLFIYDHLGGRKILPPTRTLNFKTDETGKPLKDAFKKGFEYSDCWVEDSRLVVLNARDAADRGATILTRTRCETMARKGGFWHLDLKDLSSGETRSIQAKSIVNASGPWVQKVLQNSAQYKTVDKVRLVRGSHIVTRKLFDHDRAYLFQQSDGRIVFAIPYETDFTLIGTTDVDHEGTPNDAACTSEERDYLLRAVAGYLDQEPSVDDIVWTYSGVRPLYDDGASSAIAATRDYVVKREQPKTSDAPLINIFGGKITTYRRLAESVIEKLRPTFPEMSGRWTASASLPGGDFPVDGVQSLCKKLRDAYPFLDEGWALRLVRAYGTQAKDVLHGAKTRGDLGKDFGATLTEAEVRWLMTREWAITADDVCWRRTKLGLRLTEAQRTSLDDWMKDSQAR